MEKITMSRVYKCTKCEKRESPQQGERVALWLGTRGGYLIKKVRGGIIGFTPHIIKPLQYNPKKKTMIFSRTCGIENCSVEFILNEAKDAYSIHILSKSIEELDIKEWNALVQFTDNGMECC